MCPIAYRNVVSIKQVNICEVLKIIPTSWEAFTKYTCLLLILGGIRTFSHNTKTFMFLITEFLFKISVYSHNSLLFKKNLFLRYNGHIINYTCLK